MPVTPRPAGRARAAVHEEASSQSAPLLSGTRAVTAPGTARGPRRNSKRQRTLPVALPGPACAQWQAPPSRRASPAASRSHGGPSGPLRVGFRAQVASGGSARPRARMARAEAPGRPMPRRHWHGSLRGQPDPGRSNWLRIVRRTQEPSFHRAAKIVYKRGKMDPTRSRRFVANVVCATNRTYTCDLRSPACPSRTTFLPIFHPPDGGRVRGPLCCRSFSGSYSACSGATVDRHGSGRFHSNSCGSGSIPWGIIRGGACH